MMMTVLVVAAVLAVMVLAAQPSGRAFRTPRLSWEKWFFLFLTSAFLGCCLEMGFVWLGTGTLMSRSSLLYGAFSIVWGLGAVLMTLVLNPLRRYGVWGVFAGGTVLGGGFEYLSSLVLELAYHRRFWDYSHLPLNLAGRTNLLYAAFWGVAGVVWVYRLAPYLIRLFARIPTRIGRLAGTGLALLFALDVMISAAAFQRMDERSQGQAPSNHLEQLLDGWYSDNVMQQRYQNMTVSPAGTLGLAQTFSPAPNAGPAAPWPAGERVCLTDKNTPAANVEETASTRHVTNEKSPAKAELFQWAGLSMAQAGSRQASRRNYPICSLS